MALTLQQQKDLVDRIVNLSSHQPATLFAKYSMKRGPKPKINRQDGGGTPVIPDYLEALPAAKAIWFEELERVVAAGVGDAHSSTFATYCVIESALRRIAVTGELPKGNVFTERRRLAEQLGICGVGGGLKGQPADPLNQDSNPFAALPDA